MILGTTEKRTVTPDEARAMLTKFVYDRQRRLNKQTVTYYAKLMRQGDWLPGSEIVLAHHRDDSKKEATYLINGQHRLQAIIESGVEDIMFRLSHTHCANEEEVAKLYGYTDTNKGRTIHDYINALKLDLELGFSRDDSGKIASAVSFIENNFIVSGKYTSSPQKKVDGIRQYAVAANRYIELIAGGAKAYHAFLRQIACMGVALVTLDEATGTFGDEKVEKFWSGIALDDGLAHDDPRKCAIRHIVDTVLATAKKGQRSSPQYTARYIANCFNAWVEGRSLTYTRVADATAPIFVLGTRFRGR